MLQFGYEAVAGVFGRAVGSLPQHHQVFSVFSRYVKPAFELKHLCNELKF